MKGLICVLIVLICAQSWPVEGKNRNRVQKWQQRTWKTRFGNVPRNDWKFDVPVKGRSHRRNLYAGARYGGLSQREIDMLSGNSEVPNGYSNFHYHFDEPLKTVVSYGSVRQSHRNGKKTKDIPSSTNQVQTFRMKRFALQDEDDDAEPEHFTNDLSNSPFVFDTDLRHERDEYPDDQGGYSNDLADLDFVRDDETVDFRPLQAGPNQRYITVEENDPFPHAGPPASPSGKRNATRKVQYTLIIHHGEDGGSGAELSAAAKWERRVMALLVAATLGAFRGCLNEL